MKNLMKNIGGLSPKHWPVKVVTNDDKKTAELYARQAGAVNCVDDVLPYISAKNKNGQEILKIFYGQNASQITALGVATAIFVSNQGAVSLVVQAAMGDTQPLLSATGIGFVFSNLEIEQNGIRRPLLSGLP